jgi:hypothetical protein
MLRVRDTKRLLINVLEQVEWLHADIGSVQATLQKTPEVLHGVGVDHSDDLEIGQTVKITIAADTGQVLEVRLTAKT